MGDNFQIIADVEATEAEAPALAALVIGWLAIADVIAGDPADCVPGTDPGYPPGPHHAAAVTVADAMLASLHLNGVQVHTTKTVFYPVQGEMGPVACPRCGHELDLEDPSAGELTEHWEPFGDALDDWWADGPGTVTCSHCQQASGLNDWHWTGDWPIAVGFLGFTFWNWPELNQSFIAQVAGRLGHRVVVTKGKL